MRQPSLRELAAKVMDRQPLTLAEDRHRAIIAARDAAGLDEWRAALLVGRLHMCGNCGRYAFGTDPRGSGTCTMHGEGLLAFAMPFRCPDFAVAEAPLAPGYLHLASASTIPMRLRCKR